LIKPNEYGLFCVKRLKPNRGPKPPIIQPCRWEPRTDLGRVGSIIFLVKSQASLAPITRKRARVTTFPACGSARPTRADAPGQQILVIRVGDCAYLVPFVESPEGRFLKTIIPSRKATRAYLGEHGEKDQT